MLPVGEGGLTICITDRTDTTPFSVTTATTDRSVENIIKCHQFHNFFRMLYKGNTIMRLGSSLAASRFYAKVNETLGVCHTSLMEVNRRWASITSISIMNQTIKVTLIINNINAVQLFILHRCPFYLSETMILLYMWTKYKSSSS